MTSYLNGYLRQVYDVILIKTSYLNGYLRQVYDVILIKKVNIVIFKCHHIEKVNNGIILKGQ